MHAGLAHCTIFRVGRALERPAPLLQILFLGSGHGKLLGQPRRRDAAANVEFCLTEVNSASMGFYDA